LSRINGPEADIHLRRFIPGGRALVREAHQLCPEQRIVPCPAADFDDAAGGLSESLAAASYRNDADGPTVDIHLRDRIATDVPRGLHCTMDVVLGAGVERSSSDLPIVSDSDQHDTSIGIRECDRGVLNRVPSDARLELDMLPFAGERPLELGKAHRELRRDAALGVEGRICQSSRGAVHSSRSLA
jgi:hypothetical protein